MILFNLVSIWRKINPINSKLKVDLGISWHGDFELYLYHVNGTYTRILVHKQDDIIITKPFKIRKKEEKRMTMQLVIKIKQIPINIYNRDRNLHLNWWVYMIEMYITITKTFLRAWPVICYKNDYFLLKWVYSHRK